MTKTVQSRSSVSLNETGKDLIINKPETEDNMSLLLSVFDSLNNLYKALYKLDYAITRKRIQQSIYLEGENK